MIDLKQMFKKKTTQIVVVSIIVNLIILNLVTGWFDLVSALLLVGIGLLSSSLINFKHIDLKAFFIIGAVTSLVYNWGGTLMGLFNVSLTSILLSSLQQGVITVIVARIFGVRK